MPKSFTERPVRVGIFETVQGAERAVAKLQEAGFSKDQLAVICSDQAVANHFVAQGLQDEQPADTPARAATGGVIGSILGGLGYAGLATSTGIGIVAAGALLPAVVSGAVVGSFLGAMTSRGVDKEAADFYDQAIEKGKILVVAEDHSEAKKQNLAAAERILSEAGTLPIPLADG